jgi:hypothetical protein
MRSYSLPRHSKPPFSTIPRAEERLRPLRLRPSASSRRTRRWGRCSRRSGSGSATRGPVGMTSTSVQAVMKTRTTPFLVSGLKDHLTGEVLGVISRIRAASSRYPLTPLLTPLSAQQPVRRKRLRYAGFANPCTPLQRRLAHS